MRRYLPVLIILAVAIVTAVTATWLYRAKMSPLAAKSSVAPSTVSPVSASPTGVANAPAAIPPDIAAPPEPAVIAGHVRGPADASATLEIYGDFQCPSCAKTTAVIDDLQKTYSSKLRVVFYEFPLAMHAHALEAAMAAEAAGQQDHFWEMHDMLYKYQEVWSKASNPGRFFAGYAASLGLNAEQFQTDANSAQTKSLVMAEGEAGEQRGVRNTPTIFINGEEVKGMFTPENLRAGIEAALAAKHGE